MPLMTPYRVADETFVIPACVPAPFVGNVHLNTVVIRAREPVVVDTGMPMGREEWQQALWTILDPEDVRWIFLSHEDGDHVGSLFDLLDACPNARLVTSWFELGRMEVGAHRMPDVARCVWVNHGESFDVGDRTLYALRPPFFDSPTTRGLFDPMTRLYYSVDSFGSFVPCHVEYASEMAESDWREGLLCLNRANHPWHAWVDERKWSAHVDRLQSMGAETIVTAHGPTIPASMIAEAFRLIREVPRMDPWPEPTQSDLELLLSSGMGAGAHHVPMLPPSARRLAAAEPEPAV